MKTLLRLAVLFFFGLALASSQGLAQELATVEEEAKRAFDSGRFKEAAEKYARIADSSETPGDRKGELYLNSAWAYYIAGNSKSARDSLRAAYSARPDLVVVGELYSPDFARLAQTVRAEIPRTPPSPGPAELTEMKVSARKKLADGNAEGALADLKAVGASTDPEVHVVLSEVYDKLGRTVEAEASRKRASDLQKGLVTPGGTPSPLEPMVNVLPLIEAGDKALAAGDLAGATTNARRAADLDPRSGDAHRLLAEIALAAGQEADAEREFTAALGLDTRSVRAELGLGAIAERQRKWSTAASHYSRTLELDPRNMAAATGQGRALVATGDESGARLAYGRAIEMDPSAAAVRNDLGVLFYRAGEFEQAIQHFSEATKSHPQDPAYRENLGRAYRRKSMGKEAERELSEAARLGTPSASLWSAVGHLRAEQKNMEDARAAFTSALEVEPGNEEAASGLAAALVEARQIEEAESVLVKALEATPRSGVLWNDLGVIRLRRGDFAGAVEALRKALTLEKPPEPTRGNLERAEQLLALDLAAS